MSPKCHQNVTNNFSLLLMYIQVCETMLGEETRNRELNSLRKIPDNFPKIVLTTDHLFTGVNEDGIKIMNIVDWLLSDNLYDVIY